MGKTIHLLVDYKDGAGRYYHQVFKAYNALGEETAAACVMEMLRQDGFTPWAVAAVYGATPWKSSRGCRTARQYQERRGYFT